MKADIDLATRDACPMCLDETMQVRRFSSTPTGPWWCEACIQRKFGITVAYSLCCRECHRGWMGEPRTSLAVETGDKDNRTKCPQCGGNVVTTGKFQVQPLPGS